MRTSSPQVSAHLHQTFSRRRIFQLIGILCLLSSNSVFASEILFQDNFAGTQINANLWTVTLNNLNFGNSSVVQNNGTVTFTDRGTISSVQGFTAPISVSGSFSFIQNDFEVLQVLTRSSGGPADNIYGGQSGLGFTVYKHGAFQIEIVSDTDNYTLAATNYGPFEFNQWYDFVFEDYGTNVFASLEGFDSFSTEVDPLFAPGDKLSIMNNGQYISDGTKITTIGPVTVSAVPEPSTYALLLLSAGSFWFFLKRRKA